MTHTNWDSSRTTMLDGCDLHTDQEHVSLPLDLVNDLLALCTPEDHELRERVRQAARRTQVVPKGWKLVPEVPTMEMVASGDKSCKASSWLIGGANSVPATYAAMLAAAPQPQETACNPSMQPELATFAEPEP